MVCVAVTRGGWGDVWRFEDRQSADLHPLVQYGDAILEEDDRVTRQYSTHEAGRLLQMIGDERLRQSVLMPIHPDRGLTESQRVERLAERSEEIFQGLLQISRDPPTDPTEVLRLIRSDRISTIKEGQEMADEKNKTTAAAAPKEPKAPKAPREPRAPKYADSAVITMGADKDGKKYGGDNNPKRAGSNTHTRFGYLRDGLTVGEFVKKCGNQAVAFGDLDYALKHGQIASIGEAI